MTANRLEPTTLRDSAWAMEFLNYTPERRSAFWQFVHSNGVPHIRTGRKKIQFSELAIREWITRRSSNGRAA